MDRPTHDLDMLSDADLVARTRDGDGSAFGELWRRYAGPGRAAALACTRSFDPDDLVAEAYTRVYRQIIGGGGPTTAFRAYLVRTIQNVAVSWSRQRSADSLENMGDLADPDAGEVSAAKSVDRELLVRAFSMLPERWQQVLWRTEVEGRKPRDIAPELGVAPNTVSALAYRAKEGLRQAWIQSHLRSNALSEDHRWTVERLGAYTRGKLTKREFTQVEAHLLDCTSCRSIESEAQRVAAVLPWAVLPLVAGAAGTSMFLGTTAPGTTIAAGSSPSALQRLRQRFLDASGAARVAGGTAAVGVLTVLSGAAVALTMAIGAAPDLGTSTDDGGGSDIETAPSAGVTASQDPSGTDTHPDAPPASLPPVAGTPPTPSASPRQDVPRADVPSETPHPTETPRPTETPHPTETPSPTETPRPTASPTPTPTPTPTPATPSTPRPSPSPAAPPSPPVVLEVDTGAGEERGMWFPIVSGTAQPGAIVSVSNGRADAVRVTASEDGAWTTDELTGFGPGAHVVSVTQRTTDGRVSLPTVTSLELRSPPLVFAIADDRSFSLIALGAVPGSIRVVTDEEDDWGVHELLAGHPGPYRWAGTFDWAPGPRAHTVSVQYVSGERSGPRRTVPLVNW